MKKLQREREREEEYNHIHVRQTKNVCIDMNEVVMDECTIKDRLLVKL